MVRAPKDCDSIDLKLKYVWEVLMVMVGIGTNGDLVWFASG